MEPIKRKRVTRVGSGAFSIYLPKKWVDSWAPDADDPRNVDLHIINDSLLIAPAGILRTLDLDVEPASATVQRILLSGYVRGLDRCTLRPNTGEFDNDAIANARDLLRHLDERIVATCTPQAIGFELDPELAPPAATGTDILRAMAAKIKEMLVLTAEAVDTHGADPDRCLHALSLLRLTQTEDVQRLLYQSVRLVARIELPMESVSDFQFLDLIASDMERMGGHMLRIAQTLLAEYELELPDLEYPRAHLRDRIGKRTAPTGPALEMVAGYRRGFATMDELFERCMDALLRNGTAALESMQKDAVALHITLGDGVFSAVTHHWGKETTEPEAREAFAMSRVASLMSDIVHAMQSVARHASILTAAKAP